MATQMEAPAMVPYEARNPTYNEYGTIDCEINHSVYGWVPFTATPDDPEPVGRELYSRLITGYVGPYVISPEKAASNEREWRDAEVVRVGTMIDKIEDFEIEGDSKPWRQYRALLRNWDSNPKFPQVAFRPKAPDA